MWTELPLEYEFTDFLHTNHLDQNKGNHLEAQGNRKMVTGTLSHELRIADITNIGTFRQYFD
jgi:hypothetical protein